MMTTAPPTPGEPETRLRFGAHLPLIGFSGHPDAFGLEALTAVATEARDAGYRTLAVNDHLVFATPWLDGLMALAAVLHASGDLTLATTIALPVVRGPVATAKAIAALDVLAGGRMVVGIGPGSSARDYAAVGIPFDERWARFDEAARALRSLLRKDAAPTSGRWYDTRGIVLEPAPVHPAGPPVWIGSWGSEAGLRRVARLADGWLASAYNTTPARFAAGRERLRQLLADRGRDPHRVPSVLATAFTYLTDTDADAERILRDVIAPTVRRRPDELRGRLPIGTPARVAELVQAYALAGLDELLIWPVADHVRQLRAFMGEVVPLVAGRSHG